MRREPPPLRVTFPWPSSTTSVLVLRTLAVAVMAMVTGLGPQENVITPPAATASTTAWDVQLAGVPAPITWSGWAMLTGWPAAGAAAIPVPLLPGADDWGGRGAGSGARGQRERRGQRQGQSRGHPGEPHGDRQ